MSTQLNVILSLLLLQGEISSDSVGQVNTNWFKMLGQFFFLIILFAFILFGAYYVTKLIGRFQYQKYQGSNIKIIESIIIAPQKMLQLIRIGSKYYLIGVSKEHIVYLTEIEKEMILNSETTNANPSHISFESQLKRWMDIIKKDSKNKDARSSGADHDEER